MGFFGKETVLTGSLQASHLRKASLEAVFVLHSNQFTMHRLRTCHVSGAVLKEVFGGRREEREGVRKAHGTVEG